MFKVHKSYNLYTGVKNNTIAVLCHGADIFVTYHSTVVFHYNDNTRLIQLNNGGWDTLSTRLVINRALSEINADAYMYREKGNTMLRVKEDVSEFIETASFYR